MIINNNSTLSSAISTTASIPSHQSIAELAEKLDAMSQKLFTLAHIMIKTENELGYLKVEELIAAETVYKAIMNGPNPQAFDFKYEYSNSIKIKQIERDASQNTVVTTLDELKQAIKCALDYHEKGQKAILQLQNRVVSAFSKIQSYYRQVSSDTTIFPDQEFTIEALIKNLSDYETKFLSSFTNYNELLNNKNSDPINKLEEANRLDYAYRQLVLFINRSQQTTEIYLKNIEKLVQAHQQANATFDKVDGLLTSMKNTNEYFTVSHTNNNPNQHTLFPLYKKI